MKYPGLLLVSFTGILSVSCHVDGPRSRALPETPVAMAAINSPDDDYNSDLPIADLMEGPIVFSSNRYSKDFDIIYKNLHFGINYTDGSVYLSENTNGNLDIVIENATINTAMAAIRTNSDELGPHLIPYGNVYPPQDNPYTTFVFLYSSGDGGNQNIRFLHNRTSAKWTPPQDVQFLNSPSDDAYPTFLQDTSAIYFCSNRAGNFDIYKADLNPGLTLLQNLSDATIRPVVVDPVLSSGYDDKCPMIYANVLVFTSNRPGGYGGFDLYYSLMVGGQWTAPVNFGAKINTSSDEYRPTIKKIGATTNDLMVFSSNRPGGKGGFDLYYVGIDKIITYGF